ncbi:MAG: DNA polymerase III subunit delta' [Acidobacteriota bacterium]
MAFRDIVGHRRLVNLLGRAIANGSLPPSLIFAGPDGVGKRLMALSVAEALNCLEPVIDERPPRQDACGTCRSCGKIARRVHPDVLLVEPDEKDSIKIDPIREVTGHLAYRPAEGRVRVIVVDQADLLEPPAQNALLKTLEEPPSRNVWILVTSRPAELFDTIRSRCCQLRFGPLSAGDIAGALANRHGVPAAEARASAALAVGSMGRALAAGGGALSEARAVATAVLIETAGSTEPRLRLAAAGALLQGAGKKGKARENKTPAADRSAVALRLRALAALLRDMSVMSTRAAETELVNLDLRPDLESLARSYDPDRLTRAFSAVGRAIAALERNNASPKIVADWLALQL